MSLWDETSEEVERGSDALPQGIVDVAVVGGGYTGLSTALHCAERGMCAHVLEAQHIGFGGSGRNVGLVNAAVWLPPESVRKRLGPDLGDRFLRRFSEGPRVVFSLIERHRIRCAATRTGTIHAAQGPSGLADLRARHAQWQAMGEPVELLGADEVAELVGTRAFHGGLLDHRAGTINPMAYCRGLARAAAKQGAGITTGARVTRLERAGDLWRVISTAGALRARSVVLGTNAYTDDLWPGLRDVFTPIDYLQFATAPLGKAAAHVLAGGQGLWDTGRVMFSLRRDGQGRLVVGTMGRVIGTCDAGLSRRWAERRLAALFPELGPVGLEHAWHGRIAMTPDHLPRIHQMAPGLWTAIGYSGRGIAPGTLFGIALADLLAGMDLAELPLPVTGMARAPWAGLARRLYDLAFTANQAWKSVV